MFRNYFAAALRNLTRNKLYAAINIIGLAVGFAAALLIALFVRDELSYDRWIPGYKNVYRMFMTIHMPGMGSLDGVPPDVGVADFLRQDFPQIAIARLAPESHALRRGDIEANETITWVDPNIFDVLPFPVVAGDLASALRAPDGIVLTRAMARKYFGRDNAVGGVIDLDRKTPMRVMAVIEDLPSRTHLDISALASGLAAESPFSKPGTNAAIYVRLPPNASAFAIDRALPDWIDRHFPVPPGMGKKFHELLTFRLQPVSDIHLTPSAEQTYRGSTVKAPGDPKLLVTLSITGFLILTVAVVNFVNLMTARANRRAVEVGIRKATGARRRDLVIQYIGESGLYVVIGLTLALLLVSVGLKPFNAFLNRDIGLDFAQDPTMPVVMLLLAVATMIAGGLYPAFVLSAFRPAAVLKGVLAPAGRSRLRQVLVIGQFAVLIALIVATVVINRQTVFAINAGFRLQTDQLLLISAPCPSAFKDQVADLPGVRGLACVTGSAVGMRSSDPSDSGTIGTGMNSEGATVTLETLGIGDGFFELLGLKPVAGRFFKPLLPGELLARREVVINESAMHANQFDKPADAIGRSTRFCGGQQNNGPCNNEIVGVIEDFPLHSVRTKVFPTIFEQRARFGTLAVKIDGTRAGQTLQVIDGLWKGMGMARPIDRQFYDQHIQDFYSDLVRETQVFSAFSIAAVLIACLGLFGLSVFTAESRTKEIGIRKAMGAGRADVLRLLLWEFTKPVLWANLIAWPVAYAAMHRWLDGFAYHVTIEPWIFLAASAAALLIAVFTVSGHALLVARAQPASALRYE